MRPVLLLITIVVFLLESSICLGTMTSYAMLSEFFVYFSVLILIILAIFWSDCYFQF